MTPFGIRKKLKSLVGRDQQPAIVRYPLTFVLPDGSEHRVEAEEHYTLVMASQTLPAPINTGCPDGACGKCRVEAHDGTGLSPRKDAERKVIARWMKDATPNTRLACHARVAGPGARVEVFDLFDFKSVQGDLEGT